jgi:hypothetical protein
MGSELDIRTYMSIHITRNNTLPYLSLCFINEYSYGLTVKFKHFSRSGKPHSRTLWIFLRICGKQSVCRRIEGICYIFFQK